MTPSKQIVLIGAMLVAIIQVFEPKWIPGLIVDRGADLVEPFAILLIVANALVISLALHKTNRLCDDKRSIPITWLLVAAFIFWGELVRGEIRWDGAVSKHVDYAYPNFAPYFHVLAWVVPAIAAILIFVVARDIANRTAEFMRLPPMQIGERNGMPLVSWTQIVGTGDTVASRDSRMRLFVAIGIAAIAALVGFANGGVSSAATYALAALLVGGFGLRYASSVNSQLQPVPHQKTERERREEMTVITRREDCEAFLQSDQDTIYFCIARGNGNGGALPIVECVPLTSFDNFEEGSHKRWFRSQGMPDERPDWGVIVAQSNVPRIVMVAESVHDHASLIELLSALQHSFTGRERERILAEFGEAKGKAKSVGLSQGSGLPSTF